MALTTSKTAYIKSQGYRYTFEMRAKGVGTVMTHTMLINPEEFSMDEPARVNVTQTLGGAFVTDFGMGLPTVTISGTTGYRKRNNAEGQETDGFEEFINFRERVYRYFVASSNPDFTLYWYNWEDDEQYIIQPTAFRLQRSKSQPLLYRYELRFTCLGKSTTQQSSTEFYEFCERSAQDILSATADEVSGVINRVAGLLEKYLK